MNQEYKLGDEVAVTLAGRVVATDELANGERDGRYLVAFENGQAQWVHAAQMAAAGAAAGDVHDR